MCLNRKPEGNQRKNFPSKDEIGHIHLKGMRENDRYLPMLLSWTEENSQISQLNNAEGKTMEVSDDLVADLEKIRWCKGNRPA